jgi:hypothetical protein
LTPFRRLIGTLAVVVCTTGLAAPAAIAQGCTTVPPPLGPPQEAPSVSIQTVQTTLSTATVQATVSPNNASTSYQVKYGQGSNATSVTASQALSDCTQPQAITITIDDLQPGTEYIFDVVATNTWGSNDAFMQQSTTPLPLPRLSLRLLASRTSVASGQDAAFTGVIDGDDRPYDSAFLDASSPPYQRYHEVSFVAIDGRTRIHLGNSTGAVNTSFRLRVGSYVSRPVMPTSTQS